MKITLKAWAERHYAPAPSLHTLRAWAASGQIMPKPELVGKRYMVDEHAIRMPELVSIDLDRQVQASSMSSRVQRILRAT